MHSYNVIAKYEGKKVKVDKIEVDKNGKIYAVWFINKNNQHQWAFAKDMDKLSIIKEMDDE